MALDWQFIQSFGTKELTEDQNQNEALFDQLIQYNLNGSESVEQLRKLFECSKLVMRLKANQVDVAMEEIDELENIISRETASNQKSLKSSLERSGSADKQTEQQLLELERANELLRTQLKEKDVEVNRLEQTKSNLEQTLKLNERQLANYSQEIEQLREELQIEKEQINEQLADSNLPFEQLRDMNKKFYMLLEEMKDMETMNTQLGEKVMKLNDELATATQQIQTATKEMQYMKNNLNNLQEMNEILFNEKEEHLNEIRRLKSMTDSHELENGEHLDTSSKRMQDLLEKLRLKEEELIELKSEFESMDRRKIEEEKTHFLKEISKRDNHIKLLRNQLSQAIDDIEAQTRVIENLIEKNIENIHRSDSSDADTKAAISDQNGRVLNTSQLISKLEEELRSKDKEMTILHQRNTLYEKGIYGLSEAVEEINRLSKLIKAKDNEIDNLIKELNSINLKLSNSQDELDYLKEIMNADDDLKQKLNEESEVKNDKLKILKLQKEVIRLDAEKLKLYEEVLSYRLGSMTMTRKFDIFHDPSNASLNENLPTIQVEKDDVEQRDLKQLQKLNSIQELENENRELQLAMKEILIGLKESDSRSDVIIDCPSLERLCQFFESRSINLNLANVIALKAELDILRGHNEELRMTNKRLRNDIFKIFETYSKQLLTDFVTKHQSEHPQLENKTDVDEDGNDVKSENDKINHTLIEDELYDSDLSEGEIVLNSRIVIPSSGKYQEQGTQTDPTISEIDKKTEDDLAKDSTSDLPSDDNLDKKSASPSDQIEDHQTRDLSVSHPTDQIEDSTLNEPSKEDKPTSSSNETQQPQVTNETQQVNEKSFTERAIQTELSADDVRLRRIDEIEELLKLKSVDELKELIAQKNSIDSRPAIDTDAKSVATTQIERKDTASQTIVIESNDQSAENKCTQCSLVQSLLIEFQNKIDRLDSSIVQREDSYTDRINVLQEENNRLQNELQRIVQIKDELLNQKEKQIIELNDKIVNQKEKIIDLEERKLHEKEAPSSSLPSLAKEDLNLDPNEHKDQTKLDKESIDSQLAIVNKGAVDPANQRGLINILETIIKCLQTRIEHKDEAIAHYQQLLTKTQEEHQQEIQKLMKNYKKVTEHSIKAIQSSSSVNQEQLESTLVKYNDQLNEFKSYHQKVLAEQKKTLELQTCKIKRLKTENERLKSQASSTEELNRLRIENEQLNKLVEKNVKFIEKLKNAIKEERNYKQAEVRPEPGKVMQLNKLKEETENLYKVLMSKDEQIKELQLSKWNLEKKIGEVMQANKAVLKSKTDELEKMMNDQVKLKNLLEKIEKEKSALRRKQVTVIKETTSSVAKSNKETQTDKFVNFDLNNQDNSSLFIDKFKQLDQTISTLKQQLQSCATRESELISMLEQRGLSRKDGEQASSRMSKKEFSMRSLKGRTFEINKKNSCDF